MNGKALQTVIVKELDIVVEMEVMEAEDTITDEEKLSAVYTILKGSSGPFSSMSLDEYVGAIDDSREQIKDGRFTDVADLERESENW